MNNIGDEYQVFAMNRDIYSETDVYAIKYVSRVDNSSHVKNLITYKG